MTSVSITQHKDGTAHIEVDNLRLQRVTSLLLEMRGGQRHPVVEIVYHDDKLNEVSRTLVPTTLVLRTAP